MRGRVNDYEASRARVRVGARCGPSLLVALAWLYLSGCHRSPALHLESKGATVRSAPEEDAGAAIEDAPEFVPPAGCAQEIAAALDSLPERLECTGLYADFGSKRLARGVRPYQPALTLWSDGASKERWLWLPEGAAIDASDPAAWRFPVGTKLWKEFSVDGRRIETRIWQKVRSDRWVPATYVWQDDEAIATRADGGEVEVGDETYYVPTSRECNECHGGRRERILGLDAVSLGLDGASGLSLEVLVQDGLLEPAPADLHLAIGDDGTGVAAPVLGWMHANCGVSCHNDDPNADAYQTELRLQLDPSELDGRPRTSYGAIRTAVAVAAHAQRWSGRTRIVPGSPETSLLHELVGSRGTRSMQMPPIASRRVDRESHDAIGEWIRRLASDAR